jgi:hypothetical protein
VSLGGCLGVVGWAASSIAHASGPILSVQLCCRQAGLRAIETHRGYVLGCLLARVSRARRCRPYTCNLSRDVEKKSVAYHVHYSS